MRPPRVVDPVLPSYEAFLAAHDRGLRQRRGVYFTPRPVVSYIVRSVHRILQAELGLDDGLASTATWGEVAARLDGIALPEGVAPEEPFVSILDPATGDGIFLLECVDVIERAMKHRWQRELGADSWEDARVAARWSEYVPRRLLPRLHGYELMEESCAAAHRLLSERLARSGYPLQGDDRIQVRVINTLDAPAERGQRFTVVVGNPPYVGLSANMSGSARGLVGAYKVVDGEPLNERKLWLQDDYVKFMRVAQTLIEQAGAGVLGYITNHGYLDNPTFRGMRRSLMGTFERICLLDLHGNANKKERCPDGTEDRNVFEIRQGVAICLATRGGEGDRGVYRADLWGKREAKHAWLAERTSEETSWSAIAPEPPQYGFERRGAGDAALREEYRRGWRIDDIFPVHCAGFITARDHFVVDFERAPLLRRIADLANAKLSDAEIRERYFAGRGSGRYPDGDTRSWKLPEARRRVRGDRLWRDRVVECLYRPFDVRSVYWAEWMVDWPRPEVMRHLMVPGALALSTSRAVEIDRFEHVFCSRLPMGHHTVTAKEVNHVFPLFLAPEEPGGARVPNLAPAFVEALARSLGVEPEGVKAEGVFGYIYAVLYSPRYRERYAGCLGSDFPRVPLPSRGAFEALSALGGELVGHHLLEASCAEGLLPAWVGRGAAEVERVAFDDGTVWLDRKRTRGFRGVAEEVWGFRVGGYRVCERWLRDRRGRRLTRGEVERYRRIVGAVRETLRLVSEIAKIIDEQGGLVG